MADSPSFKIALYIIKSASNPILPPKNALETERMDRLLYEKRRCIETDMDLGGGFIFFNFHPCLGKIPILINTFQMGWSHQPVMDPMQ